MASKNDIEKKRLLSRRTLAIKTIAGQTAWLDGAIRCSDGLLLWRVSDGNFVRPAAELFHNTQKAIYKVRQDAEAARKVLGDVDEWVENRQRKLEEAKLLCALKVAPVAEAPSLSALLNLMVAQSVAVDPMEPIAAAIFKHGQQAVPSLLSLANDQRLPMHSRSYAAMLLGAIQGKGTTAAVKLKEPSLTTAYKYGTAYGIEKYPELTNRILITAKHGEAIARSINEHLVACKHFALDQSVLLQLLADGMNAEEVAALMNNVVQVQPLFASINKLHAEYDYPHLIEERNRLRHALAAALTRYSATSKSAEAPVLVAQFFTQVFHALKACRVTSKGRTQLLPILDKLFALPLTVADPARELDCVRLLVAALGGVWQPKDIQKQNRNAEAVHAQLKSDYNHDLAPIPGLLNEYEDSRLLLRAHQCKLLRALHHRPGYDKELLELAVRLCTKKIEVVDCDDALDVFDAIKPLRNSPEARKLLQHLFDSPTIGKPSPWILVDIMEKIRWPSVSARQALEYLCEIYPGAFSYETRDDWNRPHRRALATLAITVILNRIEEPQRTECIDTLTACINVPRKAYPSQGQGPQEPGILAAYLCGGDANLARRLYETAFWTTKVSGELIDTWLVETNLHQAMSTHEQFARSFIQNPGDCVPFLQQLKLCHRIKLNLPKVLAQLEATPVDCTCENCDQITTFGAEAFELWSAYRAAQQILCGTHEMPQTIKKFINLTTSINKELHYLEKNNPPAGRSPNVTKRMEFLRHQKQFPEQARVAATATLCKELEKLASLTHIKAATKLMRDHIAQACNHEAFSKLGLSDEELFDLLVLRFSLEKNRNELSRLLKACLRGDLEYPLRQPANREFMAMMRERAIDTDVWLSAYPAYFTIPDTNLGALTISIERNPIEVLKMGLYFGTCLSFDGINAFSSIANATDVNKRVIYVRDRKGKVVARKLIGINADWQLAGFRTYCIFSTRATRNAIIVAVNRYAKTFAEACGITLASGTSGDIQELVSKAWYNDGAVPWADEAEAEYNANPNDEAQVVAAPQLCFGKKKNRPQDLQAAFQAENQE